jgi:hypothetical protein
MRRSGFATLVLAGILVGTLPTAIDAALPFPTEHPQSATTIAVGRRS